MNINDAFPSDYIKASDLQGRPTLLTMTIVEMGDFGRDGQKPVLHFQGTNKKLVLNKTNASTIAAVYGDQTNVWHGQQIEVYPDVTDFQGQRKDCIRVRRPQVAQQPQAPLQQGSPTGQAPVNSAPGPFDEQQQSGQIGGGSAVDLDDSIPF